jgi:uncharacterized membrane protein
MPFCASCGTQVEGKFCPKCGAAIVAGGSAPSPPSPAPYATPVASAPMADNVASTLCYVPFVGFVIAIIFLLIAPYNTNRAVRFHAFQSIFVGLAVIAVDIVFRIFFSMMLAVFGFFGLLTAILWPLFGLACFVLCLYLLISTYQGKTVVLPFIGPIAQKQAQG